jgi:hypothetical protein
MRCDWEQIQGVCGSWQGQRGLHGDSPRPEHSPPYLLRRRLAFQLDQHSYPISRVLRSKVQCLNYELIAQLLERLDVSH